MREEVLVPENPLIGGRAHHHGSDAPDEAVPRVIVFTMRYVEEPLQGVVLVSDEAVESACREVDDAGHRAHRTQIPTTSRPSVQAGQRPVRTLRADSD